jgi:hypothetical protein
MALVHEKVFASVSPIWRRTEDILADINAASSGATDVSRGTVGQIELLVKTADQRYTQRRYQAALTAYKDAWARIYRLVNPGFDSSAYARAGQFTVLPRSVALETKIQLAGTRIVDGIRPSDLTHDTVRLPLGAVEAPPPKLRRYLAYGFSEPGSANQLVQDAAVSGVGLLLDGKPASAFDVMDAALTGATRDSANVDGGLIGALQLNLASAALQLRRAEEAAKLAEQAVTGYRKRRDPVGIAQSLHVGGIAARQAGDKETATRLFAEAAETIARAGEDDERAALPLPGRIPIPAKPLSTRIPLPRLDPTAKVDLADGIEVTRDITPLVPVVGKDPRTLTFRIPGRAEGWGLLDLSDQLLNQQRARSWKVGVPTGQTTATFAVGEGKPVPAEQVADRLYRSRVGKDRAVDLSVIFVDAATVSFYLGHVYGYVLPLKIGDCFHELGQYAEAEASYLQAADYGSLNTTIEASQVWVRLARNVLQQANTLYQAENLSAARAEYEKIITRTQQVPASILYTTSALETPANEARTLIGGIDGDPLPEVNPEIAGIVLEALSLLTQLLAGLDYYGLLLSPIHTYEFLQQVSRGFAQQAIQAEREFVNFKSREELEAASRRELESAQVMAAAEVAGREQLRQAALADASAAARAVTLATTRRNDAQDERDQYAAVSATQIWAQAASQAQMAGSDSWYSEISELADKLDRGESISGERGLLAAAYTLNAGRKSRDYELARMDDTIGQLGQAIGIAVDQRDAAEARARAAGIALSAAITQKHLADEALVAFDNEMFTPDAWGRMAAMMRSIARTHLYRAIRVAKLMERAYDFENDEQLTVIKGDYGFGVANEAPGQGTGLLGGDALMADIDSFAYHAIATTTRKVSRIKDAVSLRAQYPAQFEQLLATGLLVFDTDLYDCERLHPGFYEQRIEAVEVEVIGLLADQPLHGTLTAGGVTSFRRRDGSLGSRTHAVDTMALSDFQLRDDMFLYTADTGVRGLFQGLGLGGTWQLHLPRRSNAIDLNRIFDIRLLFYYKAKFDAQLRADTLARPLRPDELVEQRTWSMRFDFPGAWYAFYRDGTAAFRLTPAQLPGNQRDFTTQQVRFRVLPTAGVTPAGIGLRITAPGGVTVDATTDAAGIVSTDQPELAPLAGIGLLGEWTVQVTGGAPLLDADGEPDFTRIDNLQAGVDYQFNYLPEVPV